MIQFWRRRRICKTYSEAKHCSVCDQLDFEEISYDVRVRRVSMRLFWIRRQEGDRGLKLDYMYKYRVYVDKDDFALAKEALHRLK